MSLSPFNNYYKLLINNAKHGNKISYYSKEKLCLTPSKYVFKIWGLIYKRIFYFTLSKTTNEQKQLFKANVALNIKWLEEFTSKPLLYSYITIIKMINNVKKIIKTYKNTNCICKNYHRYTFRIYYSWLSVAKILQKSQFFCKDKTDSEIIKDILEDVAYVINDRYIIKGVLEWGLSGIYNKYKNIEIYSKELYKTSFLNIISREPFNINIDKIVEDKNMKNYF